MSPLRLFVTAFHGYIQVPVEVADASPIVVDVVSVADRSGDQTFFNVVVKSGSIEPHVESEMILWSRGPDFLREVEGEWLFAPSGARRFAIGYLGRPPSGAGMLEVFVSDQPHGLAGGFPDSI